MKSRDKVAMVHRVILVVCLMTVLLLEGIDGCGMRIGAFNLKVYGQTKAGRPEVVASYAKIIQRYDIVLLQEIRDAAQTAILVLMNAVNELGPYTYKNISSARLGRTSSKEQYIYLYRNTTLFSIVDTYQYPDPSDVFQREPFSVKVQSIKTSVSEFILTGIHTDPDDADIEVDALKNVTDYIASMWNNNNILVLGDLNADCSYISNTKLQNLLYRAPQYLWLIGDDVDTTTSSTDCAYDRFIMSGSDFQSSVIVESADIFDFATEYGLNSTQMAGVSDHYPIEVSFKPV